MNGSHFMVMAATGNGWLQISPMFGTRDEATAHRDANLSNPLMPNVGRASTTVKGTKIENMTLRVFEIR